MTAKFNSEGPIHAPTVDGPVEIAPGIWWVGFWDSEAGLLCNPYLILDGEEAVLIDGGSRPDFPTVMRKILQIGILPGQIKALVYHHFDPDLCGSIPHLEDMIRRGDLVLISAKPNHMFIRHYSVRSPLRSLSELDFAYRFGSGRELRFTVTPYAHSQGSFMTFDVRTGVLFTSDLLGGYNTPRDFFLNLGDACRACAGVGPCVHPESPCLLKDILRFHANVFPSEQALRHAISKIRALPFTLLAPQHGALLREPRDMTLILELLEKLPDVGIDGIIRGTSHAQGMVW